MGASSTDGHNIAYITLAFLCRGVLFAQQVGRNSNSALLTFDSWQIVDAIAAWFWPVHGRIALPPVRQHMEVFAVRMCKAYPDVFLAAAIKVTTWVRFG